MSTVLHERLTSSELRAALDERTRAAFGLPVDEFLARFERGEINTRSLAASDLFLLARLLTETQETRSHTRRRALFRPLRHLMKRHGQVSARATRQ